MSRNASVQAIPSVCRVGLVLWAAVGSLLAGEGLVPVRQSSVLVAPLVETAPKIDGVLDDAAWARAQPLRDFAFKKTPARYQTEGWIARDKENFYFAARCFDDQLDKLVTAFAGGGLWKNDCIELFIVAEKRELFYSHLIVACDGRTAGSTWVPDEWGEPTRGKDLKLVAATGREKNAWTMELAVPIATFGFPITPESVWALGFCREKHSDPGEVSSFQGGFNRPKEYPELRFDGRPLVFDGLGVKNIGGSAQGFKVALASGGGRAEQEVTLRPGQRFSLPWQTLPGGLGEGQEFSVEVHAADGKLVGREKYLLAAPPRKEAPVDVSQIPPAQFVKSALDDPGFFPVGVWLQPAGPAAKYKEMGINVYVGGVDQYPRPKDKEFLDAIAKHGMVAICPWKKEYVEQKLDEHPAFLGWMFGDEPDNLNTETGRVNHTPEELLADFARIRRDDPRHPVYLNLGCGVAHERFVGRGASDEQYAQYPKACDILSFDVYPCNSIVPNGPDRLHLVARGIDRLRKWAGPERRVWCWLEANQIGKEGRAPTPDEVKTQVWMVLVHGANGYGFFCHTWAGKFNCSAIAPEIQAALPKINGEVHSLARVLNSPTVKDAATVATSLGSRVDVMVKRHEGATYVFAVNMFRKPERPTLTVQGMGDGAAEVLFENRSVEVRGGRITDDFAPYAVHRYKIRP